MSVRRNIERTFLRDDHVFAREADFLLREEHITDIPVYLHILRSVAVDRHRLGQIGGEILFLHPGGAAWR